jgi:hypothetical protein
MSFHEDLLRLYATNRIEKVTQSVEYQNLCRKYQGNQVFEAERAQIERVKKSVEEWLDKPITLAKQVEQALCLLLSERRELQTLSIYYDLVVEGYKPDWSLAQQEYFDQAWKKINFKYDFFLSFTSRYEPVPGDNPVNSYYKYFIQHALGVTEFESADRKKMNLLASCVYRHVGRTPMVGFFYPHGSHDNSLVKDKLAKACADSRVFLQLVQNIMFEAPPGRPNFCFFEYEKMNELLQNDPDRETRILFVVAERDQRLLEEPLVPQVYKSWRNHIFEKAVLYLAAVDMESREGRIEELQKYLDGLHTQIKDELLRVTMQVPV